MLYHRDASCGYSTGTDLAGASVPGVTQTVPTADPDPVSLLELLALDYSSDLGMQALFVWLPCLCGKFGLIRMSLGITVLAHAENPTLAIIDHRGYGVSCLAQGNSSTSSTAHTIAPLDFPVNYYSATRP